MPSNVVIDNDEGWRELMVQLKALGRAKGASATVGIHGDQGSDLVIYASANEFGTRDGHVPARPFLRTTVDENRREIEDGLGEAVGLALDGKQPLSVGVGKVAETVVGKVQEKISDIEDPPNAPSTIEDKIRRFGKPGTPLIAEGRMRQSVGWKPA